MITLISSQGDFCATALEEFAAYEQNIQQLFLLWG
jgi:hypothetical protein